VAFWHMQTAGLTPKVVTCGPLAKLFSARVQSQAEGVWFGQRGVGQRSLKRTCSLCRYGYACCLLALCSHLANLAPLERVALHSLVRKQHLVAVEAVLQKVLRVQQRLQHLLVALQAHHVTHVAALLRRLYDTHAKPACAPQYAVVSGAAAGETAGEVPG